MWLNSLQIFIKCLLCAKHRTTKINMTQVQPFYGVYHSVEEVDTLTDDFNKIWHYYAKSVHICHKNSEGEHIAQADVS